MRPTKMQAWDYFWEHLGGMAGIGCYDCLHAPGGKCPDHESVGTSASELADAGSSMTKRQIEAVANLVTAAVAAERRKHRKENE